MHVIKKTITALFLCYASTVYAKTDEIKCPSFDSIHQAAGLLNHIEEKCRDRICISTGEKPAFHENGIAWGLVAPIKASSKDEAILKSQTIAANVSVMLSEFIWPMWCTYYVPSSDFSEKYATQLIAIPMPDRNSRSSFIHSFLKSN